MMIQHGHLIKPSMNSHLERRKLAQQRKAEPGDTELMIRLELHPAPSKARTPLDFQEDIRDAANHPTTHRSASTTNCLQMSLNLLTMLLMSHVDITFPSSEKFEDRRQYIILASTGHKNKFMEMTQFTLDI
ncbi:unnamed protein product [Nyctereutes procyonoides]|uniref:(raccoon dog) hypothetical protein n=1 Tax=Nyctereutes procyonoides TaxID=34880 RepID=A0A811YJE2_NYCPR|nr:unnamed protein product [Nyctereutes procyonoides]